MNNSHIVTWWREFFDDVYSRKIQWTKDTKKKMELMREREIITHNDTELKKAIADIVAYGNLGIKTIERDEMER